MRNNWGKAQIGNRFAFPIQILRHNDRQLRLRFCRRLGMSERRNLVVVRAGDASLHPMWLSSRGERSWDLIVSYFGSDPNRYRSDGITRVDAAGPKWHGLFQLFRNQPGLLERYDYVWLPDDDVLISQHHINLMFETMRQHDLALAQPSLTPRSFFSWLITLQNPMTRLRWTNFVELMIPCFQSGLLQQCLPTFEGYISGWGLDWVWPKMAGVEKHRVAILDRISATHTRPIGGPNYGLFAGLPYTATDEMGHVLKKYDIDPVTRILAVETRFGRHLPANSPAAQRVLRVGMRLLVARSYIQRLPQRSNIAASVSEHLATPTTPGRETDVPDGARYVNYSQRS
jgi:hypothetical protein